MRALRKPGRFSHEAGQAAIVIIVLIAGLLLAALGIAVDYSQVWAKRQMAQAAADAACQAAAGDLFMNYQNPTAETTFGLDFSWIRGSSFSCADRPTAVPCKYAALNGYSGANVSVSFPGDVPGVDLTAYGVTKPFVKVSVSDPVNLSLTKLFSSSSLVNAKASATCGLNPIAVPIPLIVLHPSAQGALSVGGSSKVVVLGGPRRSVQVDSTSPFAVSVGTVDLHCAGPDAGGCPGSGADFGVLGGPTTKPVGVSLGSGKWISPASPFGDPWITVPQPERPTGVGAAAKAKPVIYKRNGCPDVNGCVEYTGGDYTTCSTGKINYGGNGCLVIGTGGNDFIDAPDRVAGADYVVGNAIKPTKNNPGGFTFEAISSGKASTVVNTSMIWTQSPVLSAKVTDGDITWLNVGVPPKSSYTAIFDPGVYYLGDSHGMVLNSHAMVRPSTADGDGSGGTTFFFATTASLDFGSNSGKESIDVYYPDGSTNNGVASVALQCPGGPDIPSQVPRTLSGNVLLGPCRGTYGSTDEKNRRFLFFQARNKAASPNCGGGGQFLLSGFMYFHQSSGYGTTFSMQGNCGAGAFALGNMVVDKLAMSGTPDVKMILNSATTFQILRPQLLR